jgi:hypothetical protein
MKMKGRRLHIATSIAGLVIVAALLVYYLMRDDLWKAPVHIGFAVLTGLLIWRLRQGIKQKKEEE